MEAPIRFNDDPTLWIKKFNESYPKFKWFLEKYQDVKHQDILQTLNDKNLPDKIKAIRIWKIMNIVWFRLPDKLFNIRENPDGWSEFLELIEI